MTRRRAMAGLLACASLAMPAPRADAGTLSFAEVPAPVSGGQGGSPGPRTIATSPSAVVDGREVTIGYHTVMRSGWMPDVPPGDDTGAGRAPFGTLVDSNGRPIPVDRDLRYGSTPAAVGAESFVSNDNDYSSLISRDGRLFMISHFESRPGAMYLSRLDQDRSSGKLTPLWTRPVDFSGVRGGWAHCAGSVTPWNTHLGSEEYEPDARLVDAATGSKLTHEGGPDAYYHAMAAYFQGDRRRVNPYDYGYAVEISIESVAGDTRVVKHYAMGRLSLELAYVMPDAKTVYMTDDGRFTGLYMFVADRAGDLGAGTLYAARWQQTSPDGAGVGEAVLQWVNLGHATDDGIAAYLEGDRRLAFGDIFDAHTPSGPVCGTGYHLVFKGHHQTAGGTYAECLRLREGMATAASRLETRRYAAMLGATTEFSKEEGLTFDPDSRRLYIAMSEISGGMLDGGADEAFNGATGPNHVRVGANRCGAVYAADLAGEGRVTRDTTGRPIESVYVAVNMYALVAGTPADHAGNRCDVDGIAGPDNISYLPGYRTLVIGEDTDHHRNNMVWSYDTLGGKLTRIQTVPEGAEATSLFWYPDVNGFGYLASVVQHPLRGVDAAGANAPPGAGRGYTGYIGPFPALD